MKTRVSASHRSLQALFLLGIFVFLSCFSFLGKVWAQEGGVADGETLQTNPKDRLELVTAIVESQESPPAPILIAPANGSIGNSGLVEFVWELPTPTIPYDHQELDLNGSQLFGNISIYPEENANYTLTFVNGQYHLILKGPASLPDGIYTWKIRSIDTNNRGTDSTTWTFTLDSKAPPIVITQIDQTPTAISSSDPSTVPEEPFVVNDQTPTITGTTEANATVQMTIVYPDGHTVIQTTTADGNGNFSFTLPSLVRDQIVELQFSAVDKAGNSSALAGIKVVYKPKIFRFPLLPPFLLPNVPIVEIPLAFPTPPNLPPAIQQPIAAAETELSLLKTFLLLFGWLLLPASILFVFLYLLILLKLAGNSILGYFRFAWLFLVAWLRGWQRSPDRWQEDGHQRVLPGMIFVLETLDSDAKVLAKKTLITNLYGEWQLPKDADHLFSLQLKNHRWQYPSQNMPFSEAWQPPARDIYLTGESVIRPSETAHQKWQTTTETFVLPKDWQGKVVAWAVAKVKKNSGWLRWLPRFCLLLSLALALTTELLEPRVMAVIWLVVILLILFRDAQWRVPEQWRAHVQDK